MITARLRETRIEVVRADLTQERVDGLVTAANRTLSGGNQAGFGGGVDGAVHRAAGPGLLRAAGKIGGCDPGHAVATAPGSLSVLCVIHAVGPIYGAHEGCEDELLRSAHRRSLEVAAAEGCKSVAFPAISCGVYKFPIERAAGIALKSIVDFLQQELHPIRLVRYCLLEEAPYHVFAGALWELADSEAQLSLEFWA